MKENMVDASVGLASSLVTYGPLSVTGHDGAKVSVVPPYRQHVLVRDQICQGFDACSF